MKRVVALAFEFGRRIYAPKGTFHDDTLRANQGQDRTTGFSFWRALVS